MPYLNNQDKRSVEHLVSQIVMTDIDTPGKLNYLITRLLIQAMNGKTANYTLLNAVYGAVSLAGLEFWMRIIQPYEKSKIELNGEVYK